MAEPVSPDVTLYVCCNCVAKGSRLPRQWRQDGASVLVREVPCSGKMDGQYLLHVLEGGGRGIGVITCPKGECQLAQGNYRAEIRTGMLRRLLREIGIEPERIELIHCGPDDPPGRLEQLARGAVGRISALGASPLRAEAPQTEGKR